MPEEILQQLAAYGQHLASKQARKERQVINANASARDGVVAYARQCRPPFVGHVLIQRRRRWEFQQLDLQWLPGLTAAPGALQHLPAVLRDKGKHLVLIGGKS